MAEFEEIMKIATQVCVRSNIDCCKCPFILRSGECAFNMKEDADWEEIERKALEWTKEHPEPRYPTWGEWAAQMFPEADAFTPCVFTRSNERACLISSLHCSECRAQRIPEEIAVKLGIKKIEGNEL